MTNWKHYPNFSPDELDCPCCHEVPMKEEFLEALQELRNKAGVPIRVTSGYRCTDKNTAIGGSETSRHLKGDAADIVIRGKTVLEMYNLALGIRAFLRGGIGVYPSEKSPKYGFIHVDTGGQRRWGRWKGKYMGLAKAFAEAEKALNGQS